MSGTALSTPAARRSIVILSLALVVAVVAVAQHIQSDAAFTGTVAVGSTPRNVVIDPHIGHAFVANADDDSISMLDLTGGTVIRTISLGGAPGAMAIDEGRSRLFVVTVPRTAPESVSMLDTQTGQILWTTVVGQAPAYAAGSVAIDPRHGLLVVTDDYESRVSILETQHGTIRHVITGMLDPTNAAIDARSGIAYVADTSQNAVVVLDIVHGRILRTLPVAGRPIAVQVDSSRARLYVNGYDRDIGVGSMTVLDGRSGQVLLTVAKPASLMAADPRTSMVYTIDFATDRLFATVLHTRRTRTRARWGPDAPALTAWPQAVALDSRTGALFVLMDACGRRLTGRQHFAATANGCVRVVDPRAGRLVATVTVGRAPSALAIDGETGQVVVANSRGGPTGTRPGDWVPSWLRDRFAWLFGSGSAAGAPPTGTVSIFAAPR